MSSLRTAISSNRVADDVVVLFANYVRHLRGSDFPCCSSIHWRFNANHYTAQLQQAHSLHCGDWLGLHLHNTAEWNPFSAFNKAWMRFLLLLGLQPCGIHVFGDRQPIYHLLDLLGLWFCGTGMVGTPMADQPTAELLQATRTTSAHVMTVRYRSIFKGIRIFFGGDRRRSGKDDWIPIDHPSVSITT